MERLFDKFNIKGDTRTLFYIIILFILTILLANQSTKESLINYRFLVASLNLLTLITLIAAILLINKHSSIILSFTSIGFICILIFSFGISIDERYFRSGISLLSILIILMSLLSLLLYNTYRAVKKSYVSKNSYTFLHILIAYFLTTFIVITSFTLIYEHYNSYAFYNNLDEGIYYSQQTNGLVLPENKIRFNNIAIKFDPLYFSSVTYFTVGYGDIYPKGEKLKFIVQTEMMFSHLINALFIPLLIVILTKRINLSNND